MNFDRANHSFLPPIPSYGVDFFENVNTINWKNFSTHVRIYKLEMKYKIETSFLYTSCWGFKKVLFRICTYVLAKILQNGAKFIQKLTPGFKNRRNLNNFRKAVESPKSWNLMGFCPKNTFLQLKDYIREDLSNITFNYLCENSPNYLCHFWNHKSFFSSYFLQKYPIKVLILRLSTAQAKVHQISHVTFQIKSQFFFIVLVFFQCHERQFFNTFLAETLYTIGKSSTSKFKFSDLLLLKLKFTKFLMSVFLQT